MTALGLTIYIIGTAVSVLILATAITTLALYYMPRLRMKAERAVQRWLGRDM
jgi:hypothetical protein